MAITRFAVATIILIFFLNTAGFSQSSQAQAPQTQAPQTQDPQAQGSPSQDSSAQNTQTPSSQAQASAPQEPEPEPTPAPVVVPTVQVFGGYTFTYLGLRNLNATSLDVDLNIYPRTLIPQTNFNGWSAEGQYNFSRLVGAVIDFGGTTSRPFLGGTGVTGVPTGSWYSIMAGPVVSYRKEKKVTPYVHALFGWNRTSLSAGTLGPASAIGTQFPVASVGATFTDFAMAAGGGLDYKLSSRISLRPMQLEWYRTSLNLNAFYGTAFNQTQVRGFESKQRNLRFSTGVVVNFK